MAETPNYNLYVTNDSSEGFQNWRTQMAGESNSNMVKIDNALRGKMDNCTAVNRTLLTSAWSGSEAPYTQELSVSGLDVSRDGMIALSQNATKDQRESARNAMLSVIGQESGKLIVAADGEKPEVDIPVSIILLGGITINGLYPIKAVPSQGGPLTYNGNVQSPSWLNYDSSKLAIGGTFSSTNAGVYESTFTPRFPYCWADGSTVAKTANWSIAKATGSISINPTSLELDIENRRKTITVMRAGDGVITAISSDTSIVTVSVSGNTITVNSVGEENGSATITIYVAEGTNHTTPNSIICPVTMTVLIKIYGINWDGTSSTKWTRTDDASSFADPIPYVAGVSNYNSPFDNIYPWSGMVKCEREGGTMVAVPKFWYKITKNGAGMSIQIANKAVDGFSISPAHVDRGDGEGERDVVYVGRYHCSDSDYRSITGQSPKINITRSAARTNIHSLGHHIWQSDFSMRFTIWLLYLVEFANWNSQACIGYGCGDESTNTIRITGSTDPMPYHTGTILSSRTSYGVGTQYRYIEGLWDNVLDWCDGAYYNSEGMNIILDPNKFSDSSGGINVGKPTSGYSSAFTITTKSGYPMFIPSQSIGSVSTYMCDSWNFNTSIPCLYTGGGGHQTETYGMFYIGYGTATSAYSNVGSRLQELP